MDERNIANGSVIPSEGYFLRSDNIMTETDPDRIRWRTLPDGDIGLRCPDGSPICEEANLAGLSDGSLMATCRTVAGYPVAAYSRNGGRTWTAQPMRCCPDGPILSNPRGPNFVRKLSAGRHAGRFIYWFYNNNACGKPGQPHRGYDSGSRNPAWLLGGIERDAPEGKVIHWGRPEVVLYDVHLSAAIGYPDFVEVGERLFITETQKALARVHEIPQWLLDRLWET